MHHESLAPMAVQQIGEAGGESAAGTGQAGPFEKKAFRKPQSSMRAETCRIGLQEHSNGGHEKKRDGKK